MSSATFQQALGNSWNLIGTSMQMIPRRAEQRPPRDQIFTVHPCLGPFGRCTTPRISKSPPLLLADSISIPIASRRSFRPLPPTLPPLDCEREFSPPMRIGAIKAHVSSTHQESKRVPSTSAPPSTSRFVMRLRPHSSSNSMILSERFPERCMISQPNCSRL